MAGDDLGPWDPMAVADATELLRPATFRWWISGGHALEAHLGRSWRDHDDTDIGFVRSDAPALRDLLHGWDIHVAAAGVLTPWGGHRPDAELSQNNLWCRPSPDAPWMNDVTIGDGTDEEWFYRRDPTIRHPWADAVLKATDGIRYLAPELQLLYKSRNVRPKDDLDAMTVIPLLEPERRSWLTEHLPAGHPWRRILSDHATSDPWIRKSQGSPPLPARPTAMRLP